jgi:Protein of unknown function (DUF4089)
MKRITKRKNKGTTRRPVKRTAGRKAERKSAAELKVSRAKTAAVKKAQAAPQDAIEAMVEAGAEALGLLLDPAWRTSVKFNLLLILRHAALVDEFPLPDDAEPAPVFHA